MPPEAHPNDEYRNPGSQISGPPAPPEVFPEDLAAQQAPDQGTVQTEGGSASGTGNDAGENVRDEVVDYSDTEKFKVEDLERLVRERNEGREGDAQIKPVGTGANGNIVRGDLEQALADDDARTAAA